MHSTKWCRGVVFLLLFTSYTHAQMRTEQQLQSVLTVHDQDDPLISPQKKTSTVVEFDVGTLEALGFGNEVADFFKKGTQFIPGQYDVTIHVNNNTHYRETISIGQYGQLCLTPILQNILKLKKVNIGQGCIGIEEVYPDIQITLHPNTFLIDLLIPESDFDAQSRGDELTYGGFGILNNYRLYGSYIKNATNIQNMVQGQFELGMNWKNWILRNSSNISMGNEDVNYTFNETTLTKSIASLSAQIQLGQISTQGGMYGGIPLNGVQIYADSALDTSNSLVIPVTGIAETSATVEVTQNGRLLYRTLVSAGPFELTHINGVVRGQPLQVEVIQEDGQRQKFNVITSNQANDITKQKPVFQAALGQYRTNTSSNEMYQPFIAVLEGNFYYKNIAYNTGIQLSEYYQSIASSFGRQYGENTKLNLSSSIQFSRNLVEQGFYSNSSINISFTNFSLGWSNYFQSSRYPTLERSLIKNNIENNENTGTQMVNYFSMGVGNSFWGRLGYSIGLTKFYDQQADVIVQNLSYSRKFGSLNLNVGYQNRSDNDYRLFINATLPLGRNSSLGTQFQRYRDSNTINSNLSHRVNNFWGYSLGVSRNDEQNRYNARVNTTTAYSQLNINGAWSDQAYSMLLSATGALAYIDGYVVTSPVLLGDTFGVLSVPKQSGVQINTLGGGSTKTNYFGVAAIPTLPINRKTTIKLDTKNLPLNVRLDTTSFDVAVARGTVISRKVQATIIKQLLLTISLSDGSKAPDGSSLLDESGELISIVMGDGNVMLTNEQIGKPIKLRITNQHDCVVKYQAPKIFDENELFEEANAVCE